MRLSLQATRWIAAAGMGVLVVTAGTILVTRPGSREGRLGSTAARGGAVAPAGAAAATVVERALRACSDKSGSEKIPCYRDILSWRLGTSGLDSALDVLQRLGAADVDVHREGHVYAHGLGIQAYQASKDFAKSFAQCSEIYISGCYHGVMQAYFEERGSVSAHDVATACESFKGGGQSRWLLFQCLHGMGHGLTMFYDHELPHALESCDLLPQIWDRESCYGGAFMESIMNATTPHHPATMLASGSRHDHGGGETSSRPRFKALDPEDHLYPCSVVNPKYHQACYLIQTAAILHLNGGDMAATARTCDRAPANMRPVCYQSMGRDISSWALQDAGKSIDMCSEGTAEYRPWCYFGLVKAFIDMSATTESAFAFCPEVPERPSRLKCYEGIGEQVAALTEDPSEKEGRCAQSGDPAYVAACRYGARLSDTPPHGLPRR